MKKANEVPHEHDNNSNRTRTAVVIVKRECHMMPFGDMLTVSADRLPNTVATAIQLQYTDGIQ